MSNRILIVDFGSQVTQLIARRVREAGFYSEIIPYNAEPSRFENFGAKAVILSGGPASVLDDEAPQGLGLGAEVEIGGIGPNPGADVLQCAPVVSELCHCALHHPPPTNIHP